MQQEYNSSEYPMSSALEDSLCELVIPNSITKDLYDIFSQIEGLIVDEAETILEAL
jgi:hypothetical protein